MGSKRFSSAILPPWCRKSPKIAEVLPLLYLHGLSSGDFVPAMEQFLGSSAGLSPATVTRLTVQWQADHAAFQERDLSGTDYVYVWVDGILLRIRLDEAKAAVLVVIEVRADGTKELVAMTDGSRESSESWAALLRDCARRGMRAPVLAVGDGALGFWKALREVFPDTREQRCWVHKTANVLDAMPKSAQPAAKKAIQDIYNAEDRERAERAIKTFAKLYGAKFPKAVKKITDDQDVLLAFFDYPAEHWIHLRTTNPIWVLYFPYQLGSCSPGWRSKRPALTLNPIDGHAVVLDSKCRAGRWRDPRAPGLKRACPTQPRSADVAGATLPPYREQGRHRSWKHAMASPESTLTSTPPPSHWSIREVKRRRPLPSPSHLVGSLNCWTFSATVSW